MAFPAVVYLNFGDERTAQSTKINGLPLGIKGIMPDAREFRHAKVGAAALTAGYVYTGPVLAVADTMLSYGMVCNTLAVGDTTVTVTASGTTAITKDMFADGYLTVASSTGTGAGYNYKIKTNNSAATAATCTVTLYETDKIQVATAGGSILGIRKNQYDGIVVLTADTINGGKVLGVPCATAASAQYVWIQTKGPAAVKVGATALVCGGLVTASSVTAGAVGPATAGSVTFTNTRSSVFIGTALLEAAASSYGQIDLQLD